MLESHMKLLVLVLVAPLPVQLLQICLGRGQRKVPSTWASVTYMGDLDGSSRLMAAAWKSLVCNLGHGRFSLSFFHSSTLPPKIF